MILNLPLRHLVDCKFIHWENGSVDWERADKCNGQATKQVTPAVLCNDLSADMEDAQFRRGRREWRRLDTSLDDVDRINHSPCKGTRATPGKCRSKPRMRVLHPRRISVFDAHLTRQVCIRSILDVVISGKIQSKRREFSPTCSPPTLIKFREAVLAYNTSCRLGWTSVIHGTSFGALFRLNLQTTLHVFHGTNDKALHQTGKGATDRRFVPRIMGEVRICVGFADIAIVKPGASAITRKNNGVNGSSC
mmetsp:Transcript_4060/g.8169  ORF Transcript_4060/g.8169 Transcript_4060/m.8169 type:complete len:249 (+) Transcript_4060:166-912(+)